MPPYYIPAADAVSYTTDVADVGFASRCRYLVDRPLMLLPLVTTPGAPAVPGLLVVVATLERWRPLRGGLHISRQRRDVNCGTGSRSIPMRVSGEHRQVH